MQCLGPKEWLPSPLPLPSPVLALVPVPRLALVHVHLPPLPPTLPAQARRSLPPL